MLKTTNEQQQQPPSKNFFGSVLSLCKSFPWLLLAEHSYPLLIWHLLIRTDFAQTLKILNMPQFIS